MRLGDLDALKETIHQWHYRLSNAINTTDYGMFTVGIDQAIDEQPTIDAVQVCRCRDCKHRNPENSHCDHVVGTMIYFPRKPDDFCSYGERKDGDG